MTKLVRVIGVALLSLIYCFAVGVVTNTFVNGDDENCLCPQQEQYIESIANVFHYHTPRTQSSLSNLHKIPLFNVKINIHKHCLILEIIEHCFRDVYYQYTFSFLRFNLSQLETDLIYPSHYFM